MVLFRRRLNLLVYCIAVLILSPDSNGGIRSLIQCFRDSWVSTAEMLRIGYRNNRDFKTYIRGFGPEVLNRIGALGETGHWIEIGPGQVEAMRTAFLHRRLKGRAKPKMTAIDQAEEPEETTRYSKFKEGMGKKFRFLPKTSIESLDLTTVEPADVVTDFYSAAAYSADLHAVLKTEISLLKKGGDLFIYLPLELDDSVVAGGGVGLVEMRKTRHLVIRRKDGTEVPVETYLKSIRGIEVMGVTLKNSIRGDQCVGLHLRRTGDQLFLPGLRPGKFKEGVPPEREFWLENEP